MSIDIIRYNNFHTIRKIFIGLVVMFMIIVIVFRKTITPELVCFGLFFFALAGAVQYFLFEQYKKIGCIKLNKDGQCYIEIEHKCKIVDLKQIIFYYGGYNGEAYPIEYLLTFSNYRDGSENYITLNDMTYQVLLKNKKEWFSLLSILNEMQKNGIGFDLIRQTLFKALKERKKFEKIRRTMHSI